MDRFESLSHTVWECKYHVAFIPKCRRKVLYASLRPRLAKFSGVWQSRKKAGLKKVI